MQEMNELRYVCPNCNKTFLDPVYATDKFCWNCEDLCIPVTYELFYLWEAIKVKQNKEPIIAYRSDYFPENENDVVSNRS